MEKDFAADTALFARPQQQEKSILCCVAQRHAMMYRSQPTYKACRVYGRIAELGIGVFFIGVQACAGFGTV